MSVDPRSAVRSDHADTAPAAPPPDAVRQALDRVLGGTAFAGSTRHRRLLRHLVEHHLAGDAGALKESVIAVQVFDRGADRFDAHTDSIVRVEARRLRARLARHYRLEGRHDPVRIDLPVGGYVPRCTRVAPPVPTEAVSRQARDLTERGEHFLRQPLSRATLEQALQRFDAACADSPGHAPAHVGRARAWLNLAIGWHRPPPDASREAAAALRQALTLTPDDPVAAVLLGVIEHQFEGRWASARRHFERAAALAPDHAFVHAAIGCHLMHRGRLDEAERALMHARALDPHYLNTRMHMVNLRLTQRRLDAARAELDAVRDLAPGSMPAVALAAVIALAAGQVDEAVERYREACRLAPDYPGCRVALAGALGAAGRLPDADAELAAARQAAAADGTPLSPYVVATVHARCGRIDAAFDALDASLAQRDPNAMMIPGDPSLDALHRDPRWPALCRRARGRRP